ncbi:MAG: hypothetical protein B6U89_03770 [Desulfurococcales archaeon ex4484_58]|nr:MAG: hypothetical protein B6U89_03770 [Desulfurococcales archaeon ex4484_58]
MNVLNDDVQNVKFKLHEEIRLKVASLLLDVIKSTINDLKKHLHGLDKYALTELEKIANDIEARHIIMRQEVRVGKGYIDMDLFNRIIFEFKSKESEFDEAYNKIKRVYLPDYPEALYAIITNWEKWIIYRIKHQDLIDKREIDIRERGLSGLKQELKQIIISVLKKEGYKIPPHPEIIAKVFSELINYEEKLIKIFDKISRDPRIKALYTVFKQIINLLYGGTTELKEELIKRLYIKHTLLQMIILASLSKVLNTTTNPIEACSGIDLEVDIALPYLNWWYIAYNKLSDKLGTEEKKTIEELTEKINTKVNIIEWEVLYIEDVFREYYEILIDRETRRIIGEYYTPIWIVEFMINRIKKLVGSLRNLLILDPFCGSGSFLVIAFHEKIREGEKPEEAIKEVVGFDVNPLAVSIARAELLLAYLKYYRNRHTKPKVTPQPLIFHVDSFHVMFKPGIPSISKATISELTSYIYKGYRIEELENIEKVIEKVVQKLTLHINEIKIRPGENIYDLIIFEKILADSLKLTLTSCTKDQLNQDCLKEKIIEYLKEYLKRGFKSRTGEVLKETILENIDKFSLSLANLLENYGNGIWASSIASILAPIVIKHIKPDVIITNPPWLQLTKLKALYSETIRQKARSILEITLKKEYPSIPRKAGNIIKGSDLSSIALYGALQLAEKALAFVMPRKSSFYTRSNQRSGIILTYAVLKYYEDRIEKVEIIDLNYDAFLHGDIPALLFVKFKSSKQ